jgi:hypothetical protein
MSFLKNEGRKVKQVLSRGWYQWEGIGKGERRQSWWTYYAFICENRKLRHAETILRRGGRES